MLFEGGLCIFIYRLYNYLGCILLLTSYRVYHERLSPNFLNPHSNLILKLIYYKATAGRQTGCSISELRVLWIGKLRYFPISTEPNGLLHLRNLLKANIFWS